MFTSHLGIDLAGISGPYGRFFLAGAVATVDGGRRSGPNPMEHPGEELVFVLEGALEFAVEDQPFRLQRATPFISAPTAGINGAIRAPRTPKPCGWHCDRGDLPTWRRCLPRLTAGTSDQERKRDVEVDDPMGIGTSIFLFAVGAILRFAITVSAHRREPARRRRHPDDRRRYRHDHVGHLLGFVGRFRWGRPAPGRPTWTVGVVDRPRGRQHCHRTRRTSTKHLVSPLRMAIGAAPAHAGAALVA